MNKIFKSLMAIFIIFLTLVQAQGSVRDEDRFFPSENIDKDMESFSAADSFSTKGIQYGLILNPLYLYEDNDSGKLGSYIINARLWGKVYLWDNAFLYLRVKNSYLGTTTTEGIYDTVESDNVADLDLSFISSKFKNGAIVVSAGRKFYSMGTGVVLNGRGDGGEISIYTSFLSINLLGLYTGLLLKDNNPYGLSDRDLSDGAKRTFAGATASVDFWNQKLYIFGLAQIDNGKEDEILKSRYNSQYYGLGLEGVLGDLSYFAEFIAQQGKSYIYGSDEKSSIKAFAINSGLDYFLTLPLNPAISLQYSFGSGDKYRNSVKSPTRPMGATGDDSGFIYFGTFSGGYALKPYLSNIHVFKAGFSFTPLSWSDVFYLKKMSLGAKYLYYVKDKKEAPIAQGEANLPESFIGQGIDLSLRWQIFYDLSAYINYGLFMPGDAYNSTEGNRNFIMCGANLSF